MLLPFGLFLLLTTMESHLCRSRAVYPVFYAVKIALVGGALFALRGAFSRRRGPAGAAGLGRRCWEPCCFSCGSSWTSTRRILHFLGSRTAFNPAREMATPLGVFLFLVVRFIGLVVVAPLVEELFYRNFLLRFVTDMDDFKRVPARNIFHRRVF